MTAGRGFTAIAVADLRWGIGYQGKLPAHLPGDLKYFREKTDGHILVMGRKTFASLPGGKPLPDRINIVLTGNQSWTAEGVRIAHDREGLFSLLDQLKAQEGCGDRQVFIAGGGEVYRQFLPDTDRCLITRIEETLTADTWFPDLEKSADFALGSRSDPVLENGLHYRFTEYLRR